MDQTLATLLMAKERLDALAVSDRLSVIDALAAELPTLAKLSPAEWDLKLADVEEDVATLREEAARAAARYEQAQRVYETLRRLASRGGSSAMGLRIEEHSHDVPGGRLGQVWDGAGEADGRRQTAVAQAETTREAILQVMARRPHHRWTVVAVTDDLLRYGRPVERSNVQVTGSVRDSVYA